MNLLQIVNRARIECGVSAVALLSFASLAAADLRMFNWCCQAWEDLQLANTDWEFMKIPFTFPTIAAQQLYTPTQAGAPTAMDWKRDTFRNYSTVAGFGDEMILPFMDQETFRNVYQFGNMRVTTGRPVAFTIDPTSRGLLIGPVPLAGYTVVGEYFRGPTTLAVAADDPSAPGNDLPARWHMLLVWMAAQSYASYEAAPEIKQRADHEASRLFSQLETEQSTPVTWGPSLA